MHCRCNPKGGARFKDRKKDSQGKDCELASYPLHETRYLQIKAEAHVVRSSRGAICNSRHNAARFSEVGRVGMGQKPHANQAGCFHG